MKHLLLVLFTTLLIVPGKAQQDYTATDRWVQSYQTKSDDPDGIAQDLIVNASNDFEKVRAIYQFLVHHISYDHAVAQRGIKRINHSNQDILKRRRAICWGYAQLMTHMCQRIGLEAFTVSGYSRMNEGGGNTFTKPDHAWNVIRIKDDFYPIDATWASNVTEKADHYFLTDPSIFGKDHYPTMSMWQLLDCPRPFEAFKAGAAHTDHDSLDCYPNYKDSIEQFIALPYIDRRLTEEYAGFVDNPTDENSQSFAHAVIDKAITLKEQADSLADGGSMKSAIPIYQTTIEHFEQAKTVTDLFPWQQEALGFAYFNLAQGLYQKQYSRSRRKYPEVRSALNQAKSLLLELDSASWSIQSVLQHIDKNLALIH